MRDLELEYFLGSTDAHAKKSVHDFTFCINLLLRFRCTTLLLQRTCNLHIAVKFIEEKSDVEILAIGIGHDVSRYYNRAIKITDVNELGDVMISQLSSLFETKKKYH